MTIAKEEASSFRILGGTCSINQSRKRMLCLLQKLMPTELKIRTLTFSSFRSKLYVSPFKIICVRLRSRYGTWNSVRIRTAMPEQSPVLIYWTIQRAWRPGVVLPLGFMDFSCGAQAYCTIVSKMTGSDSRVRMCDRYDTVWEYRDAKSIEWIEAEFYVHTQFGDSFRNSLSLRKILHRPWKIILHIINTTNNHTQQDHGKHAAK